MEKYKLDLQLFTGPDGMTGQDNLDVRAREIDFVTSFGKNIQALLDVLGIARMIRKENGSVLKTKEVTGELKSGDIGEGEEIPYSQYKVTEKVFDTIKIEKYRKGVSLEAIAEKGYDIASGKMLVCVNEQWFRPTDVDNLWGDPTKAQTILGWNPQKTSYEELIKIMVKHDLELVKHKTKAI